MHLKGSKRILIIVFKYTNQFGLLWIIKHINIQHSRLINIDQTLLTRQRDVPVLHTGLISCSTGTSIPPKVENPGSTSVVGSREEPTTFQAPPYVCYGKARALPTELPPPVRDNSINETLRKHLK
jgi:hypothetical protein